MILTDIYIPALDRSYDFQVEETARTESLIEEIAGMIAGETRSGECSPAGKFLLCSLDKEMILKKGESLAAQGIKNGSRLMLV